MTKKEKAHLLSKHIQARRMPSLNSMHIIIEIRKRMKQRLRRLRSLISHLKDVNRTIGLWPILTVMLVMGVAAMAQFLNLQEHLATYLRKETITGLHLVRGAVTCMAAWVV
jgi:hypothetical protein